MILSSCFFLLFLERIEMERKRNHMGFNLKNEAESYEG
jgi:hypothetical protein